MANDSITTVCILTPSGRGAVAVIALEGPNAGELAERHFHPQRPPEFAHRPQNSIVYGKWGSDPGEDIIACCRDSKCVELHCHGGAAAVRCIVDDLTAEGATEIGWRDWISGRESTSIRAAARQALADATTARTAAILLDQYVGAMETAIRRIVDLLEDPQATNQSCAMLERLLDRVPVGEHLTRPWQVVIAGPPNVGKSSLLNALLGFPRAIVLDQPGTTRDVVTALTALDGWPVQLVDTAGLRANADPLELAGIEKARQRVAAADCLVLTFDVALPWTTENQQLIDAFPKAIVVANKCDLPKQFENTLRGLPTSAVTGEGIKECVAAIVRQLVTIELLPGDAVPFTGNQVEGLRTAAEAVRGGKTAAARAALLALLA